MKYRKTIGFVGGGNMAEALAGGITGAGIVPPEDILISEPVKERRSSLQRRFGFSVTSHNGAPAAECGTVFLSVKPQILPAVLDEIGPIPGPDQVIISIAAGVPLSVLKAAFPATPVIRAMPNTPALTGNGATVIAPGGKVKEGMIAWACRLFEAVGICLVLPENMMDAVTGLSGSGPAYIFRMAEALTEAGTSLGLPPGDASRLVTQTILGAAMMMTETKMEPAALRERVTSPGGTTQAGLKAMAEAGFEDAVKKGVLAAAERSKALGKGSV
ncbi:MAG TPA: pyrroline-5-carboxylate reductase [Proteobacteria bacterium]|nr:pyrroline-5-carboxylate reductase [bacterium BMS3Abin14]HDL53524.1 pyrroline-5-carboxylate reductase [Pseudomonadota bacterium]